MGLPALALFSAEEYLLIESRSLERHEFYDGHIIAMAGASKAHGDIETNIIHMLTTRFRNRQRPCKPYGSDTRVYVSETKYFYPDVSVFCHEPNVDLQNNWRNPEIVIEILSDSTALFDQNEKATAYRQLQTLQELVLIDSRAKRITIYERQADDAWIERNFDAGALSVTIANEELVVAEIYRDIF